MKVLSAFFARYFAGSLRSSLSFLSALRYERAVDELAGASERFFSVPDDSLVFDAPARLRVGKAFFTSGRYLGLQDRADYQHVDPRLRRFAGVLIQTLRKQDIPFYVHGAFRTRAEQDALVLSGRSRAKWPMAAHCQGAAVDIVHAMHHWDLSASEWLLVGKLGKDIASRLDLDISWGGDWSFYDPAHWYLTDWKSRIRFLAEDRLPLRYTATALLSQV